MRLFDRCIGLLAPHICVGCGAEGALLCLFCKEQLIAIPSRCYRCRTPSPGGLTCLSCAKHSRLVAVSTAITYEDKAKQLVWRLKFEGAQAAATEMACLMAPLLSSQPGCIVPAPTATSRARRRGYDQAKLLARALTHQTRLPYVDCLRRHGRARQVGKGRSQRRQQVQDAFRVSGPLPQAERFIVVDDVLTTGATLEAAAEVLRAAGARRVEAVAFAAPDLGNTP